MSLMTVGGIVRAPGEGERLWVIGGSYTYKAVNAETGAYFACEVQAPAGFAIPVHEHEDEEEGFYVAMGEVTMFLGDEERRLGSGGFAFAPRGLRHAFRLETADAKLLLLVSPGPRHEAMFRAVGEPNDGTGIPPTRGVPVDPAALAEIGLRYGTRVVAPPPVR
jgi:quercetin dioxygenase-like cupin family protein